MKRKDEKIGIILLAAGASLRLGKPKQLLIFNGESLLQKAIKEARSSLISHFVLVLGANAAQIQDKIDLSGIEIMCNEKWDSGMASSMQIGLRYLIDMHRINAVLLMLCDQPYTDAEILNSIIKKYRESDKGIIASKYENTLGVPALFDEMYFEEMLTLNSSEGAKKIIFKHLDDVDAVDFPQGAVDIDTLEDYDNLINQSRS